MAHMESRGLLSSLLSGTEESSKILIQDSLSVNGAHLLKWSLCELLKRYDCVNVISTDHNPKQWINSLTNNLEHNISISYLQSNIHRLQVKYLDTLDNSYYLFEKCSKFDCHSNSSVLLIDNLSSLLLVYTCPEVCLIVHLLSSSYSSVICLLHGDLHNECAIACVCHIMTSVITLDSTDSRGAVCSITHRKRYGMVQVKDERYELVEGYKLSTIIEEDHQQHDSHVSLDPSADLTFDLTLTEQQKESRSLVVLPYTKKIGTCKILYEPDDNDDLDDSDPDDDLNI